ncbi:MAG: hypothetical protein HYX87_00580 [Chloroflexi bacterium]|nr:hypothetical protein [Chloroflexota bacterium]
MRRRKILLALLAAIMAVMVTLGIPSVALAGWEWCDDPVVYIGSTDTGFAQVNIDLATYNGDWTNYSTTIRVEVPEGITVNADDGQGATIISVNNERLRVRPAGIKTRISILVEPRQDAERDDTKVLVRISTGGRSVQTVGRVGKEIDVRLLVPLGK